MCLHPNSPLHSDVYRAWRGCFLRLPSPSCTPGLGDPLAALEGGSDDLGIWVPAPSIGRPQQAAGRGPSSIFPLNFAHNSALPGSIDLSFCLASVPNSDIFIELPPNKPRAVRILSLSLHHSTKAKQRKEARS